MVDVVCYRWTYEDGDYSNFNHSGAGAKFKVDDNGKVDIILEKPGNLGLSKPGMFKLVEAWLGKTSKHEISKEQREKLLELLK